MKKENPTSITNWRSLKTIKSLVIVNFIIALSITISFHSEKLGSVAFFYEWPDFLYSFIISLTLSYGISIIIEKTDNHISWIHNPLKRFIVEFLSVVTYAFLVGFIFSVTLLLAFYDYTYNTLPWNYIIGNTKYPIIISIIVTVIFTSRAFLFEWRRVAIASEKLRADRFEGQYQSLKNQLNPHFLFNSLNTLSNLVYEDQEKAVRFIQQLSKIYRYVLEVQKEELVTLQQELRFLESYIGLQKLRFGENLQINIEIDKDDGLLPPLSLQLLIENAIKHNVISKNAPLLISIQRINDVLIVTNNLQSKNIAEESTGIGLENIQSRLQFFTDRSLAVKKTADEFRVELPMLKS